MKLIRNIITIICISTILVIQAGASAQVRENAVAAPEIVFENGSKYLIDMVNEEREQGRVIIYTRDYGEYTKPFSEGTHEFVVVNNIVAYKNTNGAKGTYIPPDGFIICYTGNDEAFLKDIKIGVEAKLINLEVPILPDMYFKLGDLIVPINAINAPRSTGSAVLYDSSYGESTKTNAWGLEMTVEDNVVSKIVDVTNDNGTWVENNSPIPEGGVVISIHSASPFYAELRESVKIGDTVTVSVDNIKPYSAGKTRFDVINPRSLEDNPLAWDEEEGKPYDGFRGPNQMIVYDSRYGSYTGTNPYGYEVVVGGEGKIIRTGGNNSPIPKDGFVLSGHGVMAKWLQSYARLGSKVVLNRDTGEVRLIFTPDSYIDMAEFSLKQAWDSLELAKAQFRDIDYDNVQKIIDTAQAKMQLVQEQLRQGQYKELIKTVDDIQKEADQAYYRTFESRKVENRAVWIRPRETKVEEVRERLDMLKDLNINTIYLETYWGGYSIYPTKNQVMVHNPIYSGFDVLKAYIEEGHARGIKVHAWVECFLGGVSVAEKKPEWMAVSRQGDPYFTDSAGAKYYFMNPALPEVRDFLSGLYKELIKNYDIDGIQLDYIRYPESGDYTNDFSYDLYTRQLFENISGTDPMDLSPDDEGWQDWREFRVNIINSFVYRVASEMKSLKPNIFISADVRPDYEDSIEDIFQDPKDWATKDYINFLTPMSYYLFEPPVTEDINNTWSFARGHVQLDVGLATTMNIDTKILLRQIHAVREASATGVGLFEFQSLFSKGYDKALKAGVFSSPAMATSDPEQAVSLILKEIVRKIDDIYVKYGGMDEVQAQRYTKLVQDLNVDLKNAKGADLLKRGIEELLKAMDEDASLNREVAARMSTDLNVALNIVDEYIARQRFMAQHVVKVFQAELHMEELKEEKQAVLKVKALFNDNSSATMYLDSNQYVIKSSNPKSVAVDGDIIKLGRSGKATVTIEVLDSFNFDTAKGIYKKLTFTVNPSSEKPVSASALGSLKVTEVTDTRIKLDWSGTVSDSNIVGYTVYRNGRKIARTLESSFIDTDLEPDKVYFYKVYGFNSSGKTIYKSSETTVRTKSAI